MEYTQAIEWLYGQLPMFSRTGAAAYKPGLQTSERLDEYFGHPHRRFRSIHIGGTNGKGSCSHLIASMLQAQGYRTGLYTSPHLVDFRERIRVNGKMIPREAVADFVERFQASDYDGHPSFFELTMMMAFDWFARAEVDYAVIEVGMGGRLDSTNIITPQACVITNISLDHTQFLGTTPEAIAGEKAGIIKPGIPVVIGEAEGSVREVFSRRAAEVGAPIAFAQDTGLLTSIEPLEDMSGFKGNSPAVGGDFVCPLAGEYQRHNIQTVLAALQMMRGCGIEISDEAARKGLREVTATTGLRGRWEIISRKPLVIADTGHNVAGLSYNMSRLHQMMESRSGTGARLRMVIGFVADKDIEHILDLLPRDAEYYLTNAAIPRALPVDRLAGLCAAKGIEGRVYPTVKEAYRAALADAGTDDVIYAGGSTFIVADLLANIKVSIEI